MNTHLLAAATTIIGLLPALASAQEPFDYEKTKARYSVRDYAFSQQFPVNLRGLLNQ